MQHIAVKSKGFSMAYPVEKKNTQFSLSSYHFKIDKGLALWSTKELKRYIKSVRWEIQSEYNSKKLLTNSKTSPRICEEKLGDGQRQLHV